MIHVQEADFNLQTEYEALRKQSNGIGAICSFVGLMRDFNDGDNVAGMFLEHYPGMTEKALQKIADEAMQRWPLINYRIIHRVGPLQPNDQIVLVLVASAHRQAAFAACEFIMDFLKTRAPFWKKELTQQGEKWVDAKASDDDAAQRW
ncbi:MAG: molybdopterin synthase catalytic subunit MoaE [Oceanospirillaceae bacterium]|nr:molybdopterin synthase catalytic subunit MoaE [Oceanospirillaceae bacterium]MCP5349702.1 molybdopterin synthase catalytic subunit MoaE [Oceanospirillaceae bacterium]